MRHCLAFVGLMALLCCSAQGSSILGNLLTVDGAVDNMNDNSRSLIFDSEEHGEQGWDILSIGDEMVGVLQIERVNNVDPSGAGIFAVFAFKIIGEDAGNGTYHCGPIQSGSDHSLYKLLEQTGLGPAGYTDWDKSMFAFVEIENLTSDKDPFSDEYSDSNDNPLDVISNVITAANGYQIDMILGIDTNDDFLELIDIGAGGRIGNPPNGILEIVEMQTDDSGWQVLVERAGLSVLHDIYDYHYGEMAIDRWNGQLNTTTHDVILNPDGAIQTSTESVPNWHFEDDANFKLNPSVPEPGTMALVISLLATFGLVRPRVRN